MQRTFICILTLSMFALGGGAIEFAHNLTHVAMDEHHHGESHPLTHNDRNCQFHAQLHSPIVSVPIIPLLIALGLFVAFLTLLPPAIVSSRPVSRLTCRGPPVV